jgi:hypothetical protein
MARQRIINTRFWSDTFVQELAPLERYLFLYFLSNEHANIAGIYEISIGTIVFEAGLPEADIMKIIKKLDPKIIYHEGYIIIKNFHKHQNKKSFRIEAGIRIALEELPPVILTKLVEIKYPLSEFDTENRMKIKVERYLHELKTKPPSKENGFAEIAKMINS